MPLDQVADTKENRVDPRADRDPGVAGQPGDDRWGRARARRRPGSSITNMVSNWDVQHFSKLAAEGYLADPDGTLMAFFPGLPAIFWLFEQLGVPVAITGVVLSLACSAFAAAALTG